MGESPAENVSEHPREGCGSQEPLPYRPPVLWTAGREALSQNGWCQEHAGEESVGGAGYWVGWQRKASAGHRQRIS